MMGKTLSKIHISCDSGELGKYKKVEMLGKYLKRK